MITLERLFFGMGHQLMWLNRVVRQNANRTKCQPDKMPTGLFSVVGILSVPTFGWHFVRNISTCFDPLSESSGWFDEF